MKTITFLSYLKEVIKRLNCTETDLAKKLHMTQPSINRFRHGQAYPSYDTCWKLSVLTGDPLEKIILIVEETRASRKMKPVWRGIIEKMTRAGVFSLSVVLLLIVLEIASYASSGPAGIGAEGGVVGWVLCQISRVSSSLKNKLKNLVLPQYYNPVYGF